MPSVAACSAFGVDDTCLLRYAGSPVAPRVRGDAAGGRPVVTAGHFEISPAYRSLRTAAAIRRDLEILILLGR
ncbi:hypothetical protein AWN88_08745 [Agrobacterium tumefaciens]|nr:hypothetical protein AWN88_08745 [Agrobacterium tumefaciens]OAI85760.1 hypothetical protein AYO27_12780 [Rhizobium sp. GHKF11]